MNDSDKLTKQIPQGYKETEVGMIPEEWEMKRLKEFCKSSAYGPRFSGELYHPHGNVATLRTTDLDNDGNINYQSMPFASINETSFKSHFLVKDDLLITRSGTCGIASVFHAYDKPVLPGAFLIRFRLAENISPHYFRFYINSDSGQSQMQLLTLGGVQKNISGSNLLNTLFPLPPLHEQQAIAEALSDADALISSLDKLIAKKRDIKQATMQQLLTGKTRLSGFTGEWEVKKLGEVIQNLQSGISVNSTDDKVDYSTEKCILKTSSVLYGQFKPWECKRIITSDLNRAKLYPKANSLIVSRMNTPELVGECAFIPKDYYNRQLS
jgi:type I restriction enzyme S subunit